jgi:hypothetical protein
MTALRPSGPALSSKAWHVSQRNSLQKEHISGALLRKGGCSAAFVFETRFIELRLSSIHHPPDYWDYRHASSCQHSNGLEKNNRHALNQSRCIKKGFNEPLGVVTHACNSRY